MTIDTQTHSAVNSGSQSGTGGKSLGGKYLTFKLAREEYGVGILSVREIIGLLDITPVPRMPRYVRGVINLRGKVIPVVDLRVKFGLQEVQDTKLTCIIVVDVKVRDVTALVGILVDTVNEVVQIGENEIDRALNFGSQIEGNFILGAAKVKGSVKIILDVERILSLDDMTAFVGST